MALPKAFVQVFTKEVLATPQKIEDLENVTKEEYTITDGLTVNGYVKSDESILLIVISTKKAIQPPSFYNEAFTNCKLLKNETVSSMKNVYFLVYKAKDKYVVFERRDNTVSNKPGYRLSQFANLFSDTNVINDSFDIRNKMADAIQDTWSGLGLGSDIRIQFLILTWVMLTHDDIPFAKFADGKMHSLREFFESVESACSLWETAGGKGYKEAIAMTEHITGKDLISAFNNVVEYKMKNCNTKTIESMIKNQKRKFKSLVERLDTPKANQNALMVAQHLYNFIYKPHGKDVDVCKIVFDLEQKWNNRTLAATVAAKGQIYTHTMLRDLIIRLFSKNILDNSTCYDPTCGTGGFTESFHKFASKHGLKNVIAYGNEIDEDCSNMAWVAGICSDVDVRIFQGDCFHPDIKDSYIPYASIDYLLMNPPYGMNKGKLNKLPSYTDWSEDVDLRKNENIKLTEWTFCRYNLESFVKPGGWFAFVIPVSCVSENKQNNLDKMRLIENSEIWFVIRIREDIFTPQAGKACCLVIGRWLPGMRTVDEREGWRTKCIDFSQDSGEIRRKKGEVEYDKKTLKRLQNERIFDSKCVRHICKQAGGKKNVLNSIVNCYSSKEILTSEWYEERKLTATDNWLYTRREQTDISQLKSKFQDFIEDRRHERVASLNHRRDLSSLAKPENKNCEWRDVRLMDVFELLGRGKASTSDCIPDGVYPLVSASSVNNGIAGYMNEYAFGDENSLLLTITTDGEKSGTAFVQKGKFNCVSAVSVLKPRSDYNYLTEDDLVKIAFLLTNTLTKIYSWTNKLNSTRLQKETVKLPFDKKTNKLDMSSTTLFDFEGIETIKDVRVDEIFDLMPRKGVHAYGNLKNGDYPMVSRSEHNNGIMSYVDYYDYDGTYLTVSTIGGYGFVQHGKFAVTDTVFVLKLKPEYEYLEECLSALAFAMTNEFKYKYTYNNALTQQRLMNEVIPQIPFIQDPKDKSKLIIDVSGLRYIYI